MDECKLEGFCVPFGHEFGECTFLENVYCGVVDVWCGGCPVWWMSGVVDVLFYTRCGGCLVWWMSGVVDVCVVDVVQSPISGFPYMST